LRRARIQFSDSPIQRDGQDGLFKQMAAGTVPKVSLSQEWPLVLFTILVPMLFGLMVASITRPFVIDPLAFIATGIAGMVLSTIHLGKKFRAWRALLNVQTSWLSREVAAFVLFLFFSVLSFLAPTSLALRLCAVVAGFASLVSIDMVYSIAENRSAPGFCSASAVLTGLLFFTAFSELWWPFVFVSGVKFAFYGIEFVRARQRDVQRIVLSVIRIVSGFIMPLALVSGASGRVTAVLLVMLAEFINRSEFYVDLEFLTPQRQIKNDLLK
jgi:hypothetical protein